MIAPQYNTTNRECIIQHQKNYDKASKPESFISRSAFVHFCHYLLYIIMIWTMFKWFLTKLFHFFKLCECSSDLQELNQVTGTKKVIFRQMDLVTNPSISTTFIWTLHWNHYCRSTQQYDWWPTKIACVELHDITVCLYHAKHSAPPGSRVFF